MGLSKNNKNSQNCREIFVKFIRYIYLMTPLQSQLCTSKRKQFQLHDAFYWLIRVSLMVQFGGHIIFWEMVFGCFMISRPNLGCSHWWEFVYTRVLSWRHFVHSNEPVGERQHRDVIFTDVMLFFLTSLLMSFSLFRAFSKFLFKIRCYDIS